MAWTTPFTSSVGDVLTATHMNEIRDNLNHVYGSAVSTFSPTMTQSGSVTLTTATGRYRHVGYHCTLHINLDFGGTGTGANDMVIGNVPAAIAPRVSGTPVSSTMDLDIGTGYYYDSGTALYCVHVHFASSSTLKMVDVNTVSGAFFGSTPNVAIATADSLALTITYETSSASA